MKFRIVSSTLFSVVFGAIALAQQTYTMYVPESNTGIHVPTFFTTPEACFVAKEFKIYTPRDTTRLGLWQERYENKEAQIISYNFDVCALEQTAMGKRIIRLPVRTPFFVVGGKIVADGRCGNEIFEVFLPPQPEPERPAPPPPEPPASPPARIPEPEPPASPPPPVVRVPEPEPPAHQCPTCEMTIEVHQKTKIVKLSSKASEGYLSGLWFIDGKEIGKGATLMISRDRLMKLAGKGEHEIVFKASDGQGHEVVCRGTVVLEQRKKGRFWLFKIPVLNCFYAYTVDIRNWSLEGTIEKVACAALGVGAWYTIAHTGAVAALPQKIWVPGR